MQLAIVKRQPKRRCRIPRRPHANLDYFFGRLERNEGVMHDDTGPETTTSIMSSKCRAGTKILFPDLKP